MHECWTEIVTVCTKHCGFMGGGIYVGMSVPKITEAMCRDGSVTGKTGYRKTHE